MELREFIDNHMEEAKIIEIASSAVLYNDGILTDYKTFEEDLKESNIELKEVLGWDFENFGIDTNYVYGYQDSCLNPHYVGMDTRKEYIDKCKEMIEKYYTLTELREVLGIDYE